MRTELRLLLLLDWLVALAWLTRSLYWIWGSRKVPDLGGDGAFLEPETMPKLSVIVPARDEEKGIGACLRSLLATQGLPLQILAVNDRSKDATGLFMDEVAREAEAGPHSLRVLHLRDVPDGWMGKTHAMALAAAEATGAWLLFTDGDVIFAPDALRRVLAFAEADGADHLVLYPTLIYHGFGERMMLSFLHMTSIWGGRPWKLSDPKAKRDYLGLGAFNLMRRKTYEAVGGWGALRMEVLEDLRMGYTIKRSGLRQQAVFGRGLARIRWAEGGMGVVNNMTKNLFAVFRFRLSLACAAIVLLTIFYLLPFAGGALGWAGVPPLLMMLVALVLLGRRFAQLGLPSAAFAFTFPVGSALFLYAIARSVAATLLQGGVMWRGSFYPLKELRKHAGPLR